MQRSSVAARFDDVAPPARGGDAATYSTILQPRRNCWRLAEAKRFALLIDGAEFFRRLEAALWQARRSIVILGWDFDPRVCLTRDGEGSGLQLREILRRLVEDRPALEIQMLIWDMAVFYGPSSPWPLLFGEGWLQHERIRLVLDSAHPVDAAHHQKVVCIDDQVAFVGGIDLTVDRWDTPGHCADDPARCTPDGAPVEPVHDLQAVVDGPAAMALAELARRRWHAASGETLLPVRGGGHDAWPPGLAPDLERVPVAIARTQPAYRGGRAIREVARLHADVFAAAEHSIYIETQYFAAEIVFEWLAPRLQARQGPEVVVIVTKRSNGFLEQLAMGENRDRLIRRLKQVDRHGRLRVFHPVVAGAEVKIHSKLVVIDDRLLRVGSSNLNNRSMGADTECDIAIEACKDEEREAIGRMRDRLLAEHLGVALDSVRRELNATGSLIAAIERLNCGERGLRAFSGDQDGPLEPMFGTGLLDPEEPFGQRILRLFSGTSREA